MTALLLLVPECTASSSDDPSVPAVPVPFAVMGDRLAKWDGEQYRPLFIQGVNLGVAVPGTQAGDLAATREQYDRWLTQMGDLGFNAVRTYTLHYPRFYDSLSAYNRAHERSPIYLLAGVWLDEENPSQDLFDRTGTFDESIKEIVDCSHGNGSIGERLGRAFGDYRSDVSPWLAGYVIGREIAPHEVTVTNAAHPDNTSYQGAVLRLPRGTPLEAWMAERLDGLIRYERESYGVERPVSVSSWPTLDPLRHPSEAEGSDEDREAMDLENLDTSGAPGGYFASYHAYPYYPNFMTRDVAYQSVSDRFGPNAYYGYLLDLKRHYASHPLLIAEFGVPTSWGNAHFGAAGMDHGGEDEIAAGRAAARLLDDVLDAGCAGGAFFAWIDEWWKRTWIVDDLAMPRDRYRLWHNIASPEQNFGLIAFDVGAPRFAKWPSVAGQGRIRSIGADVDAEFFYVRLKLDRALSDGQTLTIGFDTYGDDLGESVLPDGTRTVRRNEFALRLTAPAEAQLYVTQAYDLYGIWHGTSADTQVFHSVASDGAAWARVRWKNDAPGTAEDGTAIPETVDEIGHFVVQSGGEAADRRAGVIVDGETIEVRVPWTLIQFADPSTLSVIDDDRATSTIETRVSDGIGLSVHLDADLQETGRFRWAGWEQAPTVTERVKASAAVFAQSLREMP